MNRTESDKIISWFLALTMAGFSQEQAYQMIAQAIRDERASQAVSSLPT